MNRVSPAMDHIRTSLSPWSASEQVQVPEQAREIIAELATLFRVNGSANVGARELHGRDEVVAARDELRLAAKRQICSYHCAPFATSPPGDAKDVIGKQALARGVQIRVLSDAAVLEEPAGVRYLMKGASAGWQVRFLPTVPMKLLISDDTAAVLGRADASADSCSVLIRESPLLDTVVSGFETMWGLATPIESKLEIAESNCEINDLDRRCLRLLASGATDDAIARMLSMSLRTVQRRVTVLITRLGASSRFQAGVNAAKRGWI